MKTESSESTKQERMGMHVPGSTHAWLHDITSHQPTSFCSSKSQIVEAQLERTAQHTVFMEVNCWRNESCSCVGSLAVMWRTFNQIVHPL